MWSRLTLLLFLLLPLFGGRASGQSFTVSAEIVPGCLIRGSAQTSGLGGGVLAFGTHPATAEGPVYAVVTSGGSAVELECTAGLALSVEIDAGLHGTAASRHLVESGGGSVPYSLFVDAGLTTPLPPSGSVGVVVPPSGVVVLPVHAVAHLTGIQQAPGTYTDTLAVTFTW